MSANVVETFGKFSFGLRPEDEDRAARLHTGSVIVDLMFQGPCGWRSFGDEMIETLQKHCATNGVLDTWVRAFAMPGRAAAEGTLPEYRQCWDASGITVGTFELEVGTPDGMLAAAATLTYRLDRLPWLSKALRAEDFRDAKARRQHALILTCQPRAPISRDLGLLDSAIDLGLRVLLLTYNSQDHVGAGCTETTDAGVSRFGAKVIEKLNENGVVVDTAHSGRRTTLDACAISGAPVIASHTSAQAVYAHARGKSDEELEAIAATGGVIGVYAVPFFLGAGRPTIEAMLDHVDYVARRVGADHVAIGTDWPLQLPRFALDRGPEVAAQIGFRPEDNVSVDNLAGFDDYRDMPNITRGLVARGYSDTDIQGILGGNFLRVFETVCG